MIKTKLDYESPFSLIVPLRPRRVICQSFDEYNRTESMDDDGYEAL